jgi:hypothetical protein
VRRKRRRTRKLFFGDGISLLVSKEALGRKKREERRR